MDVILNFILCMNLSIQDTGNLSRSEVLKLLIECDARRMGLVWLPRLLLGAMATDSVLPKP